MMRSAYFILGLIGVLVAVAIIVPSNTLTGNVITEEPCGKLGCVELCDQDAPAQLQNCSDGLVCCPTQWASGVCDYGVNCEKIREYSLYQTLEVYQDSVREQPAPVTSDFSRFFLPIIITLAIIAYFVFRRKDHDLPKD